MPINLTMPALSPTMEEGTLAKWLKKEGDAVESGDVIAEIETDKATMEYEAVDDGIIGKIIVPEGAEGVKVNAPIAVLLEEGEDTADLEAFLKGTSSNQDVKSPSSPEAKDTETKDVVVKTPKVEMTMSTKESTGGRIFVSPLAKRLAKQQNIDLAQVIGTGPHGRIIKADIEAFTPGAVVVPQTMAQAPTRTMPTDPSTGAHKLYDMLGVEYTATPNSQFRKTVASRLQESKQTVPHFYLTVEFQLDNLLAARKAINEQANGAYKISVNDFIIKACANALKAYPAANTAWTDEAILQFKHSDISVAVATDNGLITPVVKNAEELGLRDISETIKDLAVRARDGKLKPEEYQGGSFTVSNLGMFGIKNFGAIINPPQSCILAVGAGEQKPYVKDGEVKIGTFMEGTLSVDHRSVDGAVGAEFLKILKNYIENPVAMIV